MDNDPMIDESIGDTMEKEFEEAKNSVDDFKCKSVEEAIDLAYQILWDYAIENYGDSIGDIAVKITVPVDGKVFTKSWDDRENMLVAKEDRESGLERGCDCEE